jgi:hypothetical protein
MELTQTLHYCKYDVKTGKPLVVTDMVTKKTKNVRAWKRSLIDPKTGKKVYLVCEFNNSTGKAKASGARAVLQIWE